MIRSRISKVSMATAGAAFLTMGLVSAPAEAALLDFSFNTVKGGTGSFTLDTSAVDINTSSPSGLYDNAISDLNINGTNYGTRDLNVIPESLNGEPVAGFGIIFEPPATGVGMYFGDQTIAKKLPEDPSVYESKFAGGVVGSFAGDPAGLDYIPQINVQAVPEPNATAGILAIGAIVAGSRLRRKMKK